MIVELLNSLSVCAIPFMLVAVPIYGHFKGIKVYESFVEGAKEGIGTAISIIPYMLAMLTVIGMLRGSGIIELVGSLFSGVTSALSVPPELVPMGLMRSLSGAGAEGMLIDMLSQYGPDSMGGRMASVMMGSTETTFYVIAVYCGACGIKNTRHALAAGLSADIVGMVASILVTLTFFS